MKVKSKGEVSQLCPTLSDPMDHPSVGFSRQEYWSGVPLPFPQYLTIYIQKKLFGQLKEFKWGWIPDNIIELFLTLHFHKNFPISITFPNM